MPWVISVNRGLKAMGALDPIWNMEWKVMGSLFEYRFDALCHVFCVDHMIQ